LLKSYKINSKYLPNCVRYNQKEMTWLKKIQEKLLKS